MARPNFIIFLTDDQGYGDLSCMGATDFRTPNLDALAASGVLFTDWYSNSPVCSPSRASLLTGRYPGNAGVRSILAGHRTATGLPPSVPTLATALKKLRYQTAMFGKWHLGLARGSRPEDHGFDEWFGFMAGCIDYFSHIFYWGMAGGMDPIHDLWENGKEIYANGQYFTEMITERSLSWIRKAARNGRPFFLYVPYSAPHYPMHAPQKYIDRFPDLSWERQIMAAMLSAVDDSVGAIMNWPEKIPPRQVIREMAVAMDIFPTFLKAAGGDPSEYEIDGLDIMPMVVEGAPTPHKEIFWEQGGQTAVRRGKWKLVLNGQLIEGAPPKDEVHLSDLEVSIWASRSTSRTNIRSLSRNLRRRLSPGASV